MPAKTPDPLALIGEAIAKIDTAQRELHTQRDAALDRVVTDPDKAALEVETLDRKLAALAARRTTLTDAQHKHEADAREARHLERIAASEATRQAVLDAVADRISPDGLAAQLDAAMSHVLALMAQYANQGTAIQRNLQTAVNALHAGNNVRAFDILTLASSRAQGSSPDCAAAVFLFIRALVQRFGDHHLGELVMLNHFAPKAPPTLLEACKGDADFLAERLRVER